MAKKKEQAGTGSALAGLEPRVRAAVVEEVFRAVCSTYDIGDAVACDPTAYGFTRKLATQLDVPYILLQLAIVQAYSQQGQEEFTAEDCQAWVAWCRENAPERLEVANG